MKTYWGEEV